MSRWFLAVVVVLLIGTTDVAADDAADRGSVSQDPLPRASYLRFEPSYTIVAGGGSEAELHVRGVAVSRAGDLVWGIGVDQSIQDQATRTAHAGGFGDLGLTVLAGIGSARGLVGAGVSLELPTATSAALGADAFRLGPAWFAQSAALPHLDVSILVRSYVAVAGTADRASRFATKLQPSIAVSLPSGFQLSSDGEIEIDWLVASASVPVNLELGHAFGKHVFAQLGPEVDIAGRDRGNIRFVLQIDYIDP